MRLFHATKIENVPGILKDGVKKHLDGIYLSDSIEGAALWKAVQVQNQTVAVVEVEVDERAIREGERSLAGNASRYRSWKIICLHEKNPQQISHTNPFRHD